MVDPAALETSSQPRPIDGAPPIPDTMASSQVPGRETDVNATVFPTVMVFGCLCDTVLIDTVLSDTVAVAAFARCCRSPELLSVPRNFDARHAPVDYIQLFTAGKP